MANLEGNRIEEGAGQLLLAPPVLLHQLSERDVHEVGPERTLDAICFDGRHQRAKTHGGGLSCITKGKCPVQHSVQEVLRVSCSLDRSFGGGCCHNLQVLVP